MKRTIVILVFTTFFLGAKAQKPHVMVPVIVGKFAHIFDPNDAPERGDSSWYTNDHTFVKGKDGTWHAYGIIHHLPVHPWEETRFFHITAKSLSQKKWEDHGYAMHAQTGRERVLWAPHVIRDGEKWYMFYNIGNRQANAPDYASWGQLCMATSTDLFHWTGIPITPCLATRVMQGILTS